MDESEIRNKLQSALPSQRSDAAEWLRHNPDPSLVPLILDALERETVPPIRLALSRGLELAQSPIDSKKGLRESHLQGYEASLLSAVLDDLSGLIRHETDPAIGWLRRAASKEVPNFESSETNYRIETLRQRIVGLETLAAAHRLPQWSRVRLYEIIDECKPPDLGISLVTEHGVDPMDEIDTDRGLLTLIITNALRNASEAASGIQSDQTTVLIQTGITDNSFWLSITNRFQGDSFDFDHVAHTGASNKADHKGLGLSAIRMAAERLEYKIQLTASGGTVLFSLTGSRFHE
jgi:signal transduction histidine kinase